MASYITRLFELHCESLGTSLHGYHPIYTTTHLGRNRQLVTVYVQYRLGDALVSTRKDGATPEEAAKAAYIDIQANQYMYRASQHPHVVRLQEEIAIAKLNGGDKTVELRCCGQNCLQYMFWSGEKCIRNSIPVQNSVSETCAIACAMIDMARGTPCATQAHYPKGSVIYVPHSFEVSPDRWCSLMHVYTSKGMYVVRGATRPTRDGSVASAEESASAFVSKLSNI